MIRFHALHNTPEPMLDPSLRLTTRHTCTVYGAMIRPCKTRDSLLAGSVR